MLFFAHKFGSSRFVLSLVACVSILLAGCAKTGRYDPDLDKYVQDDEEIVTEPYIPRDDGKPLTPEELRAFNSKGDLDRNLSQEDSQIVELHFKFFVHERRKTFERFLQRSGRFLPYAKKVFTERGLPEDLVYLFMVESGGNPNAISPAGATGLWQFMPFTGKKFGLTQNAWIDERRDPFKATYAASDYLLKLHYDFDDWHLAAAAYNAGEGKIGRAIDGTGAGDFFELCRLDCSLEERARLKEETRQYVPRLLAVAKIMRNLELLGFEPPSPEDAYDLRPISVPPGTNLRSLAQVIGVTWDEFSGMNPGFKRTASPPTVSSTAYVPPNMISTAQVWLESKEARMYASWKEHTVKKRDNLNSIAKRYKVTAASIREANGFSRLPKAGTVIMIPTGATAIEPVATALPAQGAKVKGRSGTHTVVAGDSLYSLARTWGTDVASIRELNRLASDSLKLGQRISIPANSKNVVPAEQVRGKKKSASAATPDFESGIAKTTYSVKPGDTLYSIATGAGISVEMLCALNGITTKTKIQPGKSLILPTPKSGGKKGTSAAARIETRQSSGKKERITAAPEPKKENRQAVAKPATVTVSKGDTLYSLAKKYNVSVDALRKANKLNESSKIKLGQTLRLP